MCLCVCSLYSEDVLIRMCVRCMNDRIRTVSLSNRSICVSKFASVNREGNVTLMSHDS